MPVLAWAQDASSIAPDGYYFWHQIVEVEVHHDRTMDVTEYLCADFLEESHGFFRTIPKRFWTKRDVSEAQDGSKLEMRYNHVEIDNLEVSTEFRPDDLDSLLDIRIGSADVTVKGPKHYKITYTLTIPNDDRVDAGDLFFHSIIGSGWDCPTDTVYFSVKFDDELPAASLDSLRVFCGPEGSEDNRADEILYRRNSHELKGYYYGLGKREALTVYVPLPDGFFQKGSIPFWRILAWIALCIALLIALYLLRLEIQGDEPVTPVVTFTPSRGLTSADIGSLVDAEVNDIDLLSIIPWLAAEGYITMTPLEDGNTRITRGERVLPSDTPEYIRCIYDGFFMKHEKFLIDRPDKSFGEKWLKAKRLIVQKYGTKLSDQTNLTEVFLMTFFFALAGCFATVPPDGAVNGAIIHVFLILEMLFFCGWRGYMRHVKFSDGFLSGCVSIFLLVVLLFVVVTGAGSFFVSLNLSDSYLPKSVLMSAGAVVAGVVMFEQRLNRLSPLRRQHLGEVLGLKEFILTAEKSRLEMLLNEDERYFYRILPYAMVFGLVDEWASKFESLAVKPISEFGNAAVSAMDSLLNSHDMKHFAQRSRIAGTPVVTKSSSGGFSSSGRSYSSSGGSYHSSSSHSSRGYSGGGSGGGGGRRW